MLICENCQNVLGYEKDNVLPETIVYRCVFGLIDLDHISKCSHFKPKPKQDNTISLEKSKIFPKNSKNAKRFSSNEAKKSLQKKGQTYEEKVLERSKEQRKTFGG